MGEDMGKKNQIYAQYVKIMLSAEDPNEIYLVLKKDEPMDKKYIRQFDNMFAGKDVIITITPLIRGKKNNVPQETPFWSVEL
ncbi:MAG: hypothetical protein QXP56_04570 [Archaeoglobaceae archaeon]